MLFFLHNHQRSERFRAVVVDIELLIRFLIKLLIGFLIELLDFSPMDDATMHSEY